MDDLYASGLPATAGQNLGLDGDGPAELLCRLPGLLWRFDDDARKRLDAVLSEQFLPLILVEIQALDSREARHDGQNYTERRLRGAPAILRVLIGLGTAINVVAVLAGGGIGTLVGAKLPGAMRHTAMQAIGIVTLLVGVSNFLEFDRTSTHIVPTLTLVAVR